MKSVSNNHQSAHDLFQMQFEKIDLAKTGHMTLRCGWKTSTNM